MPQSSDKVGSFDVLPHIRVGSQPSMAAAATIFNKSHPHVATTPVGLKLVLGSITEKPRMSKKQEIMDGNRSKDQSVGVELSNGNQAPVAQVCCTHTHLHNIHCSKCNDK